MKKSLSVILALILCVSLVSCTASDSDSGKDKNNKDKDSSDVVETVDNDDEGNNESSETVADITKTDRSSVSATAQELIDTFNDNQAHFNKYYTGAEITFKGVIKSISKEQMSMQSDDIWTVGNTVVIFEDGFCLVNPPQDLSEFSAGDSVEVSGNIITATTHMMLTVHGPTKSDPTVWIDGSTAGILTESKASGIDVNSISVPELIKLFDNNQDKFNKYCTGATITRKSTISSISMNQMAMTSDTTWDVGNTVIIFEDGFCLVNPPQDIADYMPGDTVKFSGNIITAATHLMLTVHGPTKSDPTVWVDGSTLGIVG